MKKRGGFTLEVLQGCDGQKEDDIISLKKKDVPDTEAGVEREGEEERHVPSCGVGRRVDILGFL